MNNIIEEINNEKNNKKNVILSVRVTEEENEKILQFCKKYKIKKSEIFSKSISFIIKMIDSESKDFRKR